uniref:Glycosyltransferase n=1 Tax=Ignisphaera aggregans TaxID=334771 RepID=A0A7J2U5G1_9CREN
MSEAVILIATPIDSTPAGGFIRDAKLLPYFSKGFERQGFSTVIYIPVNSIVSATKLAIKGLEVNEAFKAVIRNLYDNVRRSGVDASFMDEALAESLSLLKWELNHEEPSIKVVSKIMGFGYLYTHRIKSTEEVLLRKFKKFISSSYDKILFVYSMNENIEHFASLANLVKASKLSAGIMLQSPLYTYSTLFSLSEPRLTARIASWQLNNYLRSIFIDITHKGFLKLIQAVSPAPLTESYDLVDIARRHGVEISIPVPANAFDKEILSYRNLQEKEPVAVYFGRLSPAKGVYDLLYIWRRVEKTLPKAKLMLVGSFLSEKVEKEFKDLRFRLGLKNIEYLGYFKHRKELFKRVAEAKVLVYPSHQDAFPLTVLEAVALGLLCVAYDIPALRYVYREVPSVTLVRKGDIESMSRALVEALKTDYKGYLSVQENPKLLRFLEIYGSWENVANAELSGILRHLRE